MPAQGAGYGLIAGFGCFFALLTIGLVFADYRSRGEPLFLHDANLVTIACTRALHDQLCINHRSVYAL